MVLFSIIHTLYIIHIIKWTIMYYSGFHTLIIFCPKNAFFYQQINEYFKKGGGWSPSYEVISQEKIFYFTKDCSTNTIPMTTTFH